MSLKPTPAPLLTQPRPNQPNNAPKTDKIIPKDAKNDHPDRTISRKTLDFRQIQPAEKIFPEKRSTQPISLPSYPTPSTTPAQFFLRHTRACRGYLAPRPPPVSQTWIQLNQTEQS